MTVSAIIGIILGLVKAIPIFDEWMKAIVLAYSQWKLEQEDKELRAGLSKMFADHDQRELEKAIGSDNAGKPSQDQNGLHTRPDRPQP